MKNINLNKYIQRLIETEEIELNPEWFETLELKIDEKQYLQQTEEKRLSELQKVLKKTTWIKQCLKEPIKALNFHQYFKCYREWNDITIEQISQKLSENKQTISLLLDINQKITCLPVKVMKKLIEMMKISLKDAEKLIESSYKLATLKPQYRLQLSRYHTKDSGEKGRSIKNAIDELTLKSWKAKTINTEELDRYLDKLRQEFE
jgi:hypothetical protein